MGSTAKRSAKPSARATTPAAARSRARAPIRAPGRSTTAKKPAAPAAARAAPAKKSPRAAPFPLRAVLEQLEPRLLMSADLNPLAADALFAAPAPPGGAEFRSLTDAGRSSAVTASGIAPIQRTHEVVFVDPRVPDRNQLLAGLAGQAADGRNFEIILLDPARDGIAQVTAALADRIQVDAVHFLSHGADGAVQLGATWLDAKTVAANADAIKGWGNALKADADLLFYGCDLAATARGRALVDWLAELTKADVAASTDATGGARAGGDWELEAKIGLDRGRARGRCRRARELVACARRHADRVRDARPTSLPRSNQDAGGRGDRARRPLRGRLGERRPGRRRKRRVRAPLRRERRAADRRDPRQHDDVRTIRSSLRSPWTAPGNFVVVWSGNGVGDGDGVFARRFNAAGNPIGALPEFRVNGAVSVGFNQSNPDVAMETNGDFAVVWQSDETGSIEIWLQRYLANGTAIGGAEPRIGQRRQRRRLRRHRSRWTTTAISSSRGRATMGATREYARDVTAMQASP